MLDTIDAVKKLLDVECEQFEYIEKIYSRYFSGNRNGKEKSVYGYDWYDDYDYYYGGKRYSGYYDNYYDSYYNKKPNTQPKEEEEKSLYIYISIEDKDEMFTYVSNGKTEDEVLVHLLGGDLHIRYDRESGHIFMTGPAKVVFEGDIDIVCLLQLKNRKSVQNKL